MLIIRLQRVGRKNDPSFRIVVCEKKGPPRGEYLEKVGIYDVKRGNTVFDKERVLYWISQGAQPSPTVHNLLISSGVTEGKKIPKHKKAAIQPKKEEAPSAPAVSVADEVAAEETKEVPAAAEAAVETVTEAAVEEKEELKEETPEAAA